MLLPGKKIKLSDLLLNYVDLDPQYDREVTGIAIDSRVVKSGDLFLAYSGSIVDGRDFISNAIDNGAVAVLCADSLPDKLALSKTVPVIVVPDLRWKAGFIAAKFYGYPATKLKVIGITGTNGKTSVSQYIAIALTKLKISCGIIGTVGVGFPGELTAMVNTTPDPVTLQRWLFELKEGGADAVAMEVSSQGLVQGRVNGVDFAIAVFTNLTRDHLDTHGTMENYGNAKKLLFSQYKPQQAVINIDDEFGRELIREFKTAFDVYGYTTLDGVTDEVPTVRAQNIRLELKDMQADVVTPWGSGLLRSHLLGGFNLSNLLAVVAVLGAMKIGLSDILACIADLNAVGGRMEVFGGNKKPLVIVDYAHTPDALEKALLTLRSYCHGALWCVFGCGGDRDRGKRSIMGQIAERCSDRIVITSDNPRTEDPKLIVDDILHGLMCPWAAEVEYDRAIAIQHTIANANVNDVILIAGKGHEDYQIIGKEKLRFSDQDIVRKALDVH